MNNYIADGSQSNSNHIGLDVPRNTTPQSAQIINNNNTCLICVKEFKNKKLRVFYGCGHVFCSSCLKFYLNGKIKEMNVINILCPKTGCCKIFSRQEIRTLLNKDEWKNYNACVLATLSKTDFKQIICPNKKCSKVFFSSKSTGTTKCSCGTEVCNICHYTWHKGKSCLQILDPRLSSTFKSKKASLKFCYLCKTKSNNENKVPFVICRKCNNKWCWTCGKEYKKHKCSFNSEWDPAPKELKYFILTGLYVLAVIIFFPFILLYFIIKNTGCECDDSTNQNDDLMSYGYDDPISYGGGDAGGCDARGNETCGRDGRDCGKD